MFSIPAGQWVLVRVAQSVTLNEATEHAADLVVLPPPGPGGLLKSRAYWFYNTGDQQIILSLEDRHLGGESLVPTDWRAEGGWGSNFALHDADEHFWRWLESRGAIIDFEKERIAPGDPNYAFLYAKRKPARAYLPPALDQGAVEVQSRKPSYKFVRSEDGATMLDPVALSELQTANTYIRFHDGVRSRSLEAWFDVLSEFSKDPPLDATRAEIERSMDNLSWIDDPSGGFDIDIREIINKFWSLFWIAIGSDFSSTRLEFNHSWNDNLTGDGPLAYITEALQDPTDREFYLTPVAYEADKRGNPSTWFQILDLFSVNKPRSASYADVVDAMKIVEWRAYISDGIYGGDYYNSQKLKFLLGEAMGIELDFWDLGTDWNTLLTGDGMYTYITGTMRERPTQLMRWSAKMLGGEAARSYQAMVTRIHEIYGFTGEMTPIGYATKHAVQGKTSCIRCYVNTIEEARALAKAGMSSKMGADLRRIGRTVPQIYDDLNPEDPYSLGRHFQNQTHPFSVSLASFSQADVLTQDNGEMHAYLPVELGTQHDDGTSRTQHDETSGVQWEGGDHWFDFSRNTYFEAYDENSTLCGTLIRSQVDQMAQGTVSYEQIVDGPLPEMHGYIEGISAARVYAESAEPVAGNRGDGRGAVFEMIDGVDGVSIGIEFSRNLVIGTSYSVGDQYDLTFPGTTAKYRATIAETYDVYHRFQFHQLPSVTKTPERVYAARSSAKQLAELANIVATKADFESFFPSASNLSDELFTGIRAFSQLELRQLRVAGLGVGDNPFEYDPDLSVNTPRNRPVTEFHHTTGAWVLPGTLKIFSRDANGNWVYWLRGNYADSPDQYNPFFCPNSAGDAYPGENVPRFFENANGSGGFFAISTNLQGEFAYSSDPGTAEFRGQLEEFGIGKFYVDIFDHNLDDITLLLARYKDERLRIVHLHDQIEITHEHPTLVFTTSSGQELMKVDYRDARDNSDLVWKFDPDATGLYLDGVPAHIGDAYPVVQLFGKDILITTPQENFSDFMSDWAAQEITSGAWFHISQVEFISDDESGDKVEVSIQNSAGVTSTTQVPVQTFLPLSGEMPTSREFTMLGDAYRVPVEVAFSWPPAIRERTSEFLIEYEHADPEGWIQGLGRLELRIGTQFGWTHTIMTTIHHEPSVHVFKTGKGLLYEGDEYDPQNPPLHLALLLLSSKDGQTPGFQVESSAEGDVLVVNIGEQAGERLRDYDLSSVIPPLRRPGQPEFRLQIYGHVTEPAKLPPSWWSLQVAGSSTYLLASQIIRSGPTGANRIRLAPESESLTITDWTQGLDLSQVVLNPRKKMSLSIHLDGVASTIPTSEELPSTDYSWEPLEVHVATARELLLTSTIPATISAPTNSVLWYKSDVDTQLITNFGDFVDARILLTTATTGPLAEADMPTSGNMYIDEDVHFASGGAFGLRLIKKGEAGTVHFHGKYLRDMRLSQFDGDVVLHHTSPIVEHAVWVTGTRSMDYKGSQIPVADTYVWSNDTTNPAYSIHATETVEHGHFAGVSNGLAIVYDGGRWQFVHRGEWMAQDMPRTTHSSTVTFDGSGSGLRASRLQGSNYEWRDAPEMQQNIVAGEIHLTQDATFQRTSQQTSHLRYAFPSDTYYDTGLIQSEIDQGGYTATISDEYESGGRVWQIIETTYGDYEIVLDQNNTTTNGVSWTKIDGNRYPYRTQVAYRLVPEAKNPNKEYDTPSGLGGSDPEAAGIGRMTLLSHFSGQSKFRPAIHVPGVLELEQESVTIKAGRYWVVEYGSETAVPREWQDLAADDVEVHVQQKTFNVRELDGSSVTYGHEPHDSIDSRVLGYYERDIVAWSDRRVPASE